MSVMNVEPPVERPTDVKQPNGCVEIKLKVKYLSSRPFKFDGKTRRTTVGRRGAVGKSRRRMKQAVVSSSTSPEQYGIWKRSSAAIGALS